MIIARMAGGLGNQLFQYAAARSLAQRHRAPLRFDLSWYEGRSDRRYQLDEFCMYARPARWIDYFRINPYLGLGRIARSLLGNRCRRLQGWLTNRSGLADVCRPRVAAAELEHNGVAIERFFHFDPDFASLPDNVFLSGFWLSYRFFDGVRREILREVVLKRPLNRDSQALLDRIRASESVAVHVRRGDKVDDPDYHATDIGYVISAARAIEEKIPRPVYFVFTDDLAWVMTHLDIGGEVVYAATQAEMTDCEELVMMSKCKHNIIAESSFSWWAAWLNENRDKLVISPSPRRWIKAEDYLMHDLLPDDWLIIDSDESQEGAEGDDRKACR